MKNWIRNGAGLVICVATAASARADVTTFSGAGSRGVRFWEIVGWLGPIFAVLCVLEGIQMLKKAAKSRDKEERGSETFWAFAVALGPAVIYGLVVAFTPVELPFSSSLPF